MLKDTLEKMLECLRVECLLTRLEVFRHVHDLVMTAPRILLHSSLFDSLLEETVRVLQNINQVGRDLKTMLGIIIPLLLSMMAQLMSHSCLRQLSPSAHPLIFCIVQLVSIPPIPLEHVLPQEGRDLQFHQPHESVH